MTAPYAKAVVTAELDWGNVGTEFEARVRVAAEKAAKAAQKQFDRVRLAAKVSFRANVAEFRRETQERLNRASFSANVVLRADTSRFHTDVRKATKNLPGAKVKVTPEVKNIQSFVQELEERLRVARITAPVFLAVANEADFLARIATLTRPVTQTVNIITTGDTNGPGGGPGSGGRNGGLRGGMIRRIRMQIEMDRSSVASADAQIAALETRLSAARTRQSESIDRVRVAQARLDEVNTRANSTTSQRLAAHAALTRANNELGSHTARVTQAIGDQAEAHQRLRRAQQDQNSVSRIARAAIGGLAETAMNLGRNLLSSVSPAGLLKVALLALAALSLVPLLGQLAQAAGIISLLPAVAASAVAGIATMVIGFTGVFDAFSKGSKAAEIAAKGTAAAAKQQEADARKRAQAAKAVASAERGVESALDGVDRAERGVTQSQRQAEKAQESLNRAREDAKATIDDLNFALKGTAIDERDAVLALARAREAYDKTFADPAASALDRSEAALGVDKALRRQEEVGRRNTQLAKDAAKANEKGIEGSDQVVAAKEAVAEADQGIVDANKAVVDAQDQVTLAQQNLADAQESAAEAMTSNADAVDEYADALANLSPNARAFVEQVRGLSDAWKDLRLEVQDNLFAGMGDSIVNLANNYFPLLKTGLGGIATEINSGLRRAIDDLSTDSVKLDWTTILDNTKQSIGPVIDGLTDLFGALTNIASIGSEFLPGFSNSFAETMQEFREWTESEEGENKIRNFMEKSIESLKQVKDLFLAVGDVVGGLFKTSEKTGKSMIESMTDSLREFAKWMETPDGQESMGRFWETVRETVTEIMTAVGQAIILMDKLLSLAAALGLVPDAPKPVVPLKDEHGEPILSPKGEPVPDTTLKDDRGNPVFTPEGDPVPAPVEPGFVESAKGGKGDEDRPGLNPNLPNGNINQPDVVLPAPGPVMDGTAFDPGANKWFGPWGPEKPEWLQDWGSKSRRWLINDNDDGMWSQVKGIGRWFGGLFGGGDDDKPRSNLSELEKTPTGRGPGGAVLLPETVPGPNTGGGRSGGQKQYTREEWEKTFGDVDTFDAKLEELQRKAIETQEVGSSNFGTFGSNAAQALISLGTGDFTTFKTSLSDLAKNIFGTTEDGKLNFDGLRTKIGEVIGNIVEKLFPGLKPGLDKVIQWVSETTTNFGGIWDGLKAAAAGPINWIIDHVINGALKSAWDGLKGILPGLPDWNGVDRIEVSGSGKGDGPELKQKFYKGGIAGIMPGYTPGRDPFTIGVSGGEAIMRPEWTRAMGPDYVHEMNAIARTQGIAGVRRQAGYFSQGGIVDNLTSIMAEKYPMLTMTSGYRTTDNGYHSRGMAADFSNGGIEGTPEMKSASQWWYENFGSTLRELIHMPFNNNVKDGQNVGNGMSLYGEGTMLEHRHHLHVATDRMLNGDGTSSPAEPGFLDRVKNAVGDAVNFGRNALAGQARNMIAKPFDAVKSLLPDFGPSAFAQIPNVMIDTIRDAVTSKALGLVGLSGSSDDAGTTPWDLGAGVEQWRGKVIEALEREGFDSGIRNQNLMLAQIMSESSGNPNAIQQVQDVNSGGNEAVGLLQVIPGTFASHRNPNLPNDRTNPDASMSAALRWYRHAYGDDLGAMWGQGHGYDQGGIANGIGVMPKFTLQPERVLSPEMTADFERLISVLERPDFIDVLRQITSDAVTNAATAASVSSGVTAPAPEVNIAAAESGPSTAFDPNNTGYDDTFYNDTVARGGKEGADAWLARQDFGPQIRTWGINALKEIGGEFASPLGLERRWGEAVDQGAKEYMRATTGGGGDTYNITQEFHGYNGTPQQFAAEMERAARQGLATLTPV